MNKTRKSVRATEDAITNNTILEYIGIASLRVAAEFLDMQDKEGVI